MPPSKNGVTIPRSKGTGALRRRTASPPLLISVAFGSSPVALIPWADPRYAASRPNRVRVPVASRRFQLPATPVIARAVLPVKFMTPPPSATSVPPPIRGCGPLFTTGGAEPGSPVWALAAADAAPSRAKASHTVLIVDRIVPSFSKVHRSTGRAGVASNARVCAAHPTVVTTDRTRRPPRPGVTTRENAAASLALGFPGDGALAVAAADLAGSLYDARVGFDLPLVSGGHLAAVTLAGHRERHLAVLEAPFGDGGLTPAATHAPGELVAGHLEGGGLLEALAVGALKGPGPGAAGVSLAGRLLGGRLLGGGLVLGPGDARGEGDRDGQTLQCTHAGPTPGRGVG